MKTDCSKLSLTLDPTVTTVIGSDRYGTITTNIVINDDDIYDAIRNVRWRRTDMEEKKARGICFDTLEKTLRKMGIFLTEIHQDSYNDYAEITCRVNPIDWYISLDEKDTNKYWGIPAMKKDVKPHPKKVIFSGPATTILWTDGTKTTVRCSSEDVWEDEVGIAMCYLKKMLGNKGNYNNIFREAMKVAVVAEPKTKGVSSSKDSGTCVTSTFDSMSEIARINKCINDAANALLSKTVKEKK